MYVDCIFISGLKYMENKDFLLELIEHRESDCVEFKSSIASSSIHDMVAFLNTRGGIIFFGVNDTGEIIGLQESHIHQKISDLLQAVEPAPKSEIHVLHRGQKKIGCLELSSNGRLYSYKQKVWIRVGANNRPLDLHELFTFAGESALFSFDQQLSQIPTHDANSRLMKAYLMLRNKHRNFSIPKEALGAILDKLGYAREGRLTYGGLLLFGRSVNKTMINNRIYVVTFKDRMDREVLDSKEFRGNLLKMIDDVLDYLHTSIPIVSSVKDRERIDIPLIPIEMLRELVTNALLHRNYVDTNEVKIFLAHNSIEIANPGSFLPGISPEKPRHKTRNNLLAQYLFEIGRIEKYGSGLPTIFKLAKVHNLEVTYHLDSFSTRVIIRAKSSDQDFDTIIEVMKDTSRVSAAQVSKLTGISRSTLQRKLQIMIDEEKICKEGIGKATRYFLPTKQ